MDSNLITKSIQTAVATNLLLLTWCQTYYLCDPIIQVGVDLENLPPAEDMPWVGISPMSQELGRVTSPEELFFVINCAIYDEAELVVSGNAKHFEQVYALEEFRQLVALAIAAADLGGGYVSALTIDHDPVESFPYFSTNMAIKIERPKQHREAWLS